MLNFAPLKMSFEGQNVDLFYKAFQAHFMGQKTRAKARAKTALRLPLF